VRVDSLRRGDLRFLSFLLIPKPESRFPFFFTQALIHLDTQALVAVARFREYQTAARAPNSVPAVFVMRSLKLESLDGRYACNNSMAKLTPNPTTTAKTTATTIPPPFAKGPPSNPPPFAKGDTGGFSCLVTADRRLSSVGCRLSCRIAALVPAPSPLVPFPALWLVACGLWLSGP